MPPSSEIQLSQSSRFPKDVSYRFWGTLIVQPSRDIYSNLEVDEKPLLVVGRHPATRIFPIIAGIFALGLPLLFGPVFFSVLPSSFSPYLAATAWAWYALVFYYFINLFVVWRSDVYLITNERVLDFDANAFSLKKVTDIDLNSIHTVSFSESGGVIKGGINYGNVEVTVVGEPEPVIMQNVPMANQVSTLIGELVESARNL